jgi:hypothetical protein
VQSGSAAALPSGTRYYECENEQCPRPIPAQDIELLIWQQYVLLYESTDIVVPTQARREALRRRLTRIRIGEDIFEYWCDWKGATLLPVQGCQASTGRSAVALGST